MDRTRLLARLERAKRIARLGQDQIDQQAMMVATLFAEGSEVTEAENRLHVYQKLHDRYVSDINRILNTLDDRPPFRSWHD